MEKSKATDLYSHLAECDGCCGRLRALKAIREDFSGTWDSWLEHYVQMAAIRPPVFAGAPAESETVGAVFEVATRVVMAATRRVVGIATQGVLELMGEASAYTFALCPQYSGVAGPGTAARVADLVEEGSALLGAGRASEALERFDQAVQDAPRGLEAVELRVSSADGARAVEVHLHARRRSISVLLYPEVTAAGAWVAVLLTPNHREVAREAFGFVPGAEYLLAEFTGVVDGEYVVGVRRG
jgi:hypothetical protein